MQSAPSVLVRCLARTLTSRPLIVVFMTSTRPSDLVNLNRRAQSGLGAHSLCSPSTRRRKCGGTFVKFGTTQNRTSLVVDLPGVGKIRKCFQRLHGVLATITLLVKARRFLSNSGHGEVGVRGPPPVPSASKL